MDSANVHFGQKECECGTEEYDFLVGPLITG